MSEASETARAELVAAEILHEAWGPVGRSLDPMRYALVTNLIALSYLRGQHDGITHAMNIYAGPKKSAS